MWRKCETCIHFTQNEDKSCCIECGVVRDDGEDNKLYIRSITHFKNLYFEKTIPATVSVLFGEKLQNQASKFLMKQNPIQYEKRVCDDTKDKDCKDYPILYYEYIKFLRDNENEILPQKPRKKTIFGIYGEHKQIILDYLNYL